MRRPSFAALLATLAVASSAAAQHVYFDGRTGAYPPRTIRVYLDAGGSLYPQPNGPAIDREQLHEAETLERYFLTSTRWRAAAGRWATSAAYAGPIPWSEVQDTATVRVSRMVAAALAQARQPATLVVLIHGFNVVKAEQTYQAARDTLAHRAPPGSLVFLEVHWDGTDKQLGWFSARGHAPRVGVTLRRVLGAVPAEVPVRVLTHSLGGSVAASALLDRRLDVAHLVDKAQLRLAERTPLPGPDDLHVAMIVPAIPGEAFAPPGGAGAHLHRIAVGQNPYDFAVNKAGLGADLFGSTALATSPEVYHRHVPRRLGPGDLGCRIAIRNTPMPSGTWIRRGIMAIKGHTAQVDEHSFDLYLANASLRPLLDLLMSEKPGDRC